MAELTLISPLLDGMTVVSNLSTRSGASCYTLKHGGLDKLFVVKLLSIPESEEKTQALLLSGAFTDEAAANAYYGQVVEDLKEELSVREKLSNVPNFSAVLGFQVEPKQSGIGYDVYILSEYSKTLLELMQERGMTGLNAVNLGIDIANALSALRKVGLVFENLKPENVFVDAQDRFMVGDLGIAKTDFLQFSSLPEQYKGIYTAPEFSNMMENLNLTMDTYALGMLLYRIYNGYHGPFEDEKTSPAGAEQRRMAGEELPTPLYADYELSEIILKACAPKQEDRFQSPADFSQALTLYMQRNNISNELIVPPIVAEPEPELTKEELDEEVEPVSFTDVSSLSSEFVNSFKPDTGKLPEISDAEKAEAPAATVALLSPEQAEQQDAEIAALIDSTNEMLGTRTEQAAEEAVPDAPEAPAAEAEDVSAVEEAAPDTQDEAEAAADEEAETEESTEDDSTTIMTLPEKVEESESATANEKPSLELVESDEEPNPLDSTEEPAQSPTEKAKKRPKKRLIGLLVTVGVVLLVLVAIYFFLFRWYFIEVKRIDLVEKGYDYLTISLDATADSGNLEITCTDTRNSYTPERSGSLVTFRGLSSNTSYTIEISASDSHKLTRSSVTQVTYTTYEATDIKAISLHLGEQDGSLEVGVELNGGREPEKYLLSYTSGNAEAKTLELSAADTYAVLKDLELNQTYTFTLLDYEDFFMVGNTTAEITMMPVVQAENLRAGDYILDGSSTALVVQWDCTKDAPAQWNVHVTDGEEFRADFTTAEPSCRIDGVRLDTAYEVIVSAVGLYEDLTCTITAEPFIVKNLAATETDGSISVTWDSLGSNPADGWTLEYTVVGTENNPILLAAEGNAATVKNVIPNVTYRIALKTEETNTLVGEVLVECKTGAGTEFSDYNVKATNMAMNLYQCPDFTDWNYTDIGDNEKKDTFSLKETIAFCVQCMAGNRTKSEDTVVIHYVIRDSAGAPVVFYSSEPNSSTTWDEMWANNSRYCGEVAAPEAAGSYSLEIYVNGKLLSSSSFTVK